MADDAIVSAVRPSVAPPKAGRPSTGGTAPRPAEDLPARLTLAIDPRRQPRFSLTLLVDRAPDPLDADIAPHVRSALLAMDVAASSAAGPPAGAPSRDLVRDLQLRLVDDGGATLVRTAPAGIAASGHIGCVLGRDHALAVLAALDGEAGGLAVEGRYRPMRGAAPRVERTVSVPLHALLAPAFADRDLEPFVAIVAPGDPGRSPLRYIRRLTRRPGDRDASPAVAAGMLALRNERLVSLGADLRTAKTVKSHALLKSGLVATGAASTALKLKHAWVHDLVLADPDAPKSLPIVLQPDAELWDDRVDGALRWYAPVPELVMPDPAGPAETGAFDFTFRRIGTAADGRPALSASVRLTLRLGPSAATRTAIAALPAGVTARPVPVEGLSVAVSVPFVDAESGRPRRTELAATASVEGDLVTVEVDLLGDMVRLTYGALSTEGFQAEALRASLAYHFTAYVPLKEKDLTGASGGKQAVVPITPRPVHADLWIRGQRLRIEADDAPGARGPLAAAAFKANPLIAAHLQSKKSAASIAVQPLVVQPALSFSEVATQIIAATRYGEQTQLRSHEVDVLVPCERFGAFYREERDGLAHPVGCVDALSLGRTELRCYAEIEALAEPGFRVFRSLQQPGRFLVLPTGYGIARFPAGAGERAYRPAITLYAALDPTEDANNRVVFRAALEPDLPVPVRRRLLAVLASEAPSPVIELPTTIPADVEFAWTLGGGVGVEAEAFKTPEGFQVALATDVAGALLLKEMIEGGDLRGQARFRLPDGRTLETMLTLDLGAIVGPWSSGPVEIGLAGAASTLRNRAEGAVDVASVAAYRGGALLADVPVDVRLAPDAMHALALPADADEAFAIAAAPPGQQPVIDEVRTMVEQVRVNLVFVDLVDRAAHGLAALAIEARLDGEADAVPVEMAGQPARGAAEFMLPITRYVGDPTLQFRAIKTTAAGERVATGWREWRLATAGNVVSLTWDLIQ